MLSLVELEKSFDAHFGLGSVDSSACNTEAILARLLECAEQEGLAMSKGKGEDIVDDEEDSTIVENAVQLLPDNLPPTPSDLCDCHGVPCGVCPGWTFHCNICFDEFVPGSVRKYHAANCHTMVCDACVQDMLTMHVRNGEVRQLHCPSCGFHLTTLEVARHLEPEDVERYHRFLLRRALAHNPKLLECKNPGCDNAVLIEDACMRDSWSCEMCEKVCPWCKQEAHSGKKCEAMKKYERAEATHKRWVALGSARKCPGCKTPIIKNGGCPHMTCKHCAFQFCWMCRKDWSEHNMCIYEKFALAGAIALSPVIVTVAVTGVVVLGVPLMGADALAGHKLGKGRSLARRAWSKAKDLYWDYF